ncbi:MAG: hypothetical protein EFT35_02275, partial [Methanophagales archaeon ANME-1-THS]
LADYLNADLLLNVTSVDGIYDADPRKYPNAGGLEPKPHRIDESIRRASSSRRLCSRLNVSPCLKHSSAFSSSPTSL